MKTGRVMILNLLLQNCSLLIKTVEESGVIMREIRDLEDQVCSLVITRLVFWSSVYDTQAGYQHIVMSARELSIASE